jgi:glycerol-3-phosphate dehydrogenase
MGTTAPHLVRRLPFLVPDVAGRDVTALAAAGGRLGDAVRLSVPGGRGSLPSTRRVSRDEVARLVPGVRGGRGGVVFWDGQLVDDARLVVALARTAAAHGASVLTGASVTAVDGADVHVELENGEAMTLRAGAVVNAAGVWAQRLAPRIRLVPSRGSHLVIPGSRLGSPSAALTVPLPGSRSRYVFALPQADGLVYLGLTDEPVSGPVPDDDPVPSDAEVQQLLDTVNQVLTSPLTRDDLVGAYAGYRPLVLAESAGTDHGPRGPAPATADLSRKHLLRWDGPVLSVVGGKLTTYRAMAEETVDAVVERLGRGAARSLTGRLPLVGAAPSAVLSRIAAPARLVARYGTEAPVVEALGPSLVVAGRPETVGELRFAVRHEGARHVSDLLDRRTRIGLVPADRARAVPEAERVLAESS